MTINQYRNIDAVTIKGVEAAFEVDLGQGFDVFGNLAWQDGEDQTADEYLTTIAPVNGTLGVGYRGDVWSGEAVTRWADDMNKVNPGDQTTPAWGVLDLTARYEPSDRWSLSAGIHNVLDTRYVEYASVAGLSTRNDLTQFERGGRAYTIQLRADF